MVWFSCLSHLTHERKQSVAGGLKLLVLANNGQLIENTDRHHMTQSAVKTV